MCQISKVNLVVNAICAILFLVMAICLMNQSTMEELQQVTIPSILIIMMIGGFVQKKPSVTVSSPGSKS